MTQVARTGPNPLSWVQAHGKYFGESSTMKPHHFLHSKVVYDATRFGAGSTACSMLLLMSMHASTGSEMPTGSDLLLACRNAIESGFDGMTGQMCTWYATPCDCSIDARLPRVCLPENLSMADTARIVIRGLINDPELQEQSATQAATLILAREYPCREVE